MKPHPECGACLVHWVYERAAPHTSSADTSGLIRRIVGILLKETTPDANLGSLCNSTVHAALEMTPRLSKHYENLKAESNDHARQVLPEAAAYILAADTARSSFERSCRLAAAANVSPLNAPAGPYTFSELRPLMNGEDAAPVLVGDIYDAVRVARRVLYVTDNAGEIGFDSLVLTQLKAMGKEVILVVKTKPFFEDATTTDARFFALHDLVDDMVTTPGFLVPGALEPRVEQAFGESDLVMSKGTGSFEAMKDALGVRPAIFMLKVKCPAIARETGFEIGTTLVKLEGV